MMPIKYRNCLISTLEMKSPEQEVCKAKMHKFWDWDLAREEANAYCDCNPSFITNEDVIRTLNPDGYKVYLEKHRAYMDFLKTSPWSFTIIGTVGNGKTTLACGLVNEFNRCSQEEAVYMTQSEMVEKYKNGFDYSVLGYFCNVKMLVLDEIRKDAMTDFSKEFMQRILNSRYSNNRKTVLIANDSPENFVTTFQEHIISRLREGMTMGMKAPDMRERSAF